MIKTIAKIACVALLVSGATACKKDKKGGKADDKAKDDTAGKMTEKPDKPVAEEKAKLDTPEDRVAFLRGCYDAFNAHDMDKFGKCYAEDMTATMPDSGMPDISGRAAFVEHLSMFTTAMPDIKMTPTLILASTDNKVAVAVVGTGTHSGPLKMGDHELAATSKKVGIQELHLVEFDPAKGGIVKHTNMLDHGTFMGQLGMNPMPHRPAMDAPAGEPTIVIAKGDDAEKANIDLYKKSMEAWEKRDMKAASAVMADNVVIHDMTAPKDSDKKSADKMTAEVWKAFPDAKGEVLDLWAAGDYVFSLSKNGGTNKGAMPSMGLKKPTGKPMSFTSADINKISGGKVVESWMFFDAMAIGKQLGLIPDMPAGGGDKAAAPEGDKGAEKKPAEGEKKMDEKPAAEGGAGGN